MAVYGGYEWLRKWVGGDADTRPETGPTKAKYGDVYFNEDTGLWERYTGAGWKVLPAKHQPTFPDSFDLDYGAGTGANAGVTAGSTLYTDFSASSTPELFSAGGIVWQIKVTCNTNNGRCRIWKGTFSGLVFTFDSYTEVVDVSGLSPGWVTLTGGVDFDIFEVTASTALVFYSDNTNGMYYGKLSSGYTGYNSDDPPYSSDLTFGNLAGGRMDVLVQGAQ